MVTLRKLLQSRIAVSAGKMMRLEISIVPIILIPTTIVSAVRSAMSILYAFVFTPDAFAKSLSNVTAKILL